MAGPSITNPANAIPNWQACSPTSVVKANAQATTTDAVALPSTIFASRVVLKAPLANAAPVAIGPAGVKLNTGFILDPGDQVTLSIPDLKQIYLVGANTTDTLTWIGF